MVLGRGAGGRPNLIPGGAQARPAEGCHLDELAMLASHEPVVALVDPGSRCLFFLFLFSFRVEARPVSLLTLVRA